MALLAKLAPAAQEAAWADLRQQLAVFGGAAGWSGPNALLLATGRK